MQIGKQSVVKPLFLMTACCHRNTLLSFVVFVAGSLVKQCLRKSGMTEYQIEISVTGSYHVTISTAVSEEHARELALVYFHEEYPDFDGVVVSVEQIND